MSLLLIKKLTFFFVYRFYFWPNRNIVEFVLLVVEIHHLTFVVPMII